MVLSGNVSFQRGTLLFQAAFHGKDRKIHFLSNQFMKAQYVIITISGLALILFAALGVPRIIINTNVNAYEGEERIFALHALKSFKQLIGGSVEPLIVTSLKVEEVYESGQYIQPGGCGEKPFITKKRYEAVVKGYTVFGVPYTTIRVTCTGARRD
jgi:hypothetical protein